MVVEFIILTKSRVDLLQKCLFSLVPCQPQSVVVVINGSDQASVQLAQSFQEKIKIQILELSQEVSPAEARQQALLKSQADWICFLDDDVEVAPEFLTNFLNLKKMNPEILVFGGPNLSPPQSNFVQWLSGELMASRWGASSCSARYRQMDFDTRGKESFLILCNLWFHRKSLVSFGGFPGHFVCGEENKVLAQFDEGTFFASNKLAVWHHRRADWNSFFHQIFKYGVGRGQNIVHGHWHWFHLVPLGALLSGVFLFFGSLPGLATLAAGYLVLDIFFCAQLVLQRQNKSFSWAVTFLTALAAFPLLHFFYALGVLRGLILELKS